jgi:cytochrome c biogenesis protein CcmG, thiol:disulfide interchange protein DsbE
MKWLLLALVALAPPGADDPDDGGGPWLGVTLGEKQGHVTIEGVFGGSPAEAAGLAQGDVVKSVGGAAISRSAQLIKAVLQTGVGKALQLHIAARSGAERDVAVKLAARPDFRELQKQTLVGKTAPDFAIKKAQGVYAPQLSSMKGQVVLLDFWATWCMPCMEALPHMQQLHERLGKKGLRVIGVTSEPWQKVGDVVKRRGLTYGQISDEENLIGMRYLVTALPTIIVIGKDGKVQSVTVGDWGSATRAVDELLR